MLISRDWRCMNKRCGRVFHSFEKGNPECTWCGCARVAWIPGGGHIGTGAAAVDKTVSSLAADYGMSQVNTPSPSRLNRAMPKFSQPPIASDMPVKHFAPGFSAGISRGFDGTGGATCQVSDAQVNVKGSTQIGVPLRPTAKFGGEQTPGPQAMTQIGGRHAGGSR